MDVEIPGTARASSLIAHSGNRKFVSIRDAGRDVDRDRLLFCGPSAAGAIGAPLARDHARAPALFAGLREEHEPPRLCRSAAPAASRARPRLTRRNLPETFARFARNLAPHAKTTIDPAERFFERDIQSVVNILSIQASAIGARSRSAEQVWKYVDLPTFFEREVEPLETVADGLRVPRRLRLRPDTVVALAAFRVDENFERLRDTLVADRRDVVSRIDIGVVLACELSERATDLGSRGARLHAEKHVIVVPGHVRFCLFLFVRVHDLGVDDILAVRPRALGGLRRVGAALAGFFVHELGKPVARFLEHLPCVPNPLDLRFFERFAGILERCLDLRGVRFRGSSPDARSEASRSDR